MKPVCLINPPSIFLLDERVFLSLGILRVAAVLEQAGHPVEHLDLNGIENYVEAVKDHVSRTEANTFGLTATTPQIPATAKIVEAIREVRPNAKIILGGPHITLVNAAVKREARLGLLGRAHRAYSKLADMFDVLVAGDGESAVFEAIKDGAPQLVDADDPKSVLWMTNEQYDEMPFPARHLVDVGSYHYSIDGVPALSMLAQTGCPYMCSFCGGRNSPMLRRIRMRTTANILREIEGMYRDYGVTGVMLYDDEVNVNREMIPLMNGIADMGQRLGVEFRLRGFIKSNLFTDEQANAMYRAGFRWILVGFESGSPRILENIQKKATLEQNTRCMEIAKNHGLKVKALMSMGHAGETEETVLMTHKWLLEQKPEDFDLTIITCYPGTGYYDEAVQDANDPSVWTYTFPKNGDRLHSYEVDFMETADFYKGAMDEYKSYVFTDYLKPEDIVRLRDFVERDVRDKLGIPFNAGSPGVRFEASIGQLPGYMLRRSNEPDLMRRKSNANSLLA